MSLPSPSGPPPRLSVRVTLARLVTGRRVGLPEMPTGYLVVLCAIGMTSIAYGQDALRASRRLVASTAADVGPVGSLADPLAWVSVAGVALLALLVALLAWMVAGVCREVGSRAR